jgi:hypothetical protein
MVRIEAVENAMLEERDSIAFIGASSTGSVTSEPARKELIQRTSRNSRTVCWKARNTPTTKTPRIRPLRPGLLEKAAEIWRVRMAAMKATMARNTSIDRTKTCGLDSLCGSYSITSDEPTNPKDLSMPILAPYPFPAMKPPRL